MFKATIWAALALSLSSTVGLADVTVTVIDRDTRKGIEADVYHTKKDGPLGKSQLPEGSVRLRKVSCGTGDYFYAKPKTAHHHARSDDFPCKGGKVVISIRSTSQKKKIQNIAHAYEIDKNYAKAAQAYNEAYGSGVASAYLPTILNTARALGLNDKSALVYDRRQKKEVPSRVLVNRITRFQEENGLPASGRIDYATLQVLAGGSVAENVFYR